MGTKARAQSLNPREKKLREEWSKITQKEISMIYRAITDFLSRIFLPCIIWKNKLSYNLPKRHSNNNILAFFRTSKSFYENFHQANWGSTWGLKFVLTVHISVNYAWRHSTFNSLPIIISLFFIFTLFLIEANLKF